MKFKNIIPIIKYIWLTLKHKTFVFRAGLKVKAPLWNLLTHDWTKFTWHEVQHYGRQFFGDQSDPLAFSYAWNHHQKTNKHHWEYYIPITGHNRGGYKDLEPLPMPEKYVREMVADWYGASRAYEGKWPKNGKWKWFDNNFDKIKLHPETKKLVLMIIKNNWR